MGACYSICANAHTCYPDTAYCPIDSQRVVFCVTMSYTTFGSYYDFQKKGAVGNHYEELINGCHNCHFSGYLKDFKSKYSKSRKDSILILLEKYKDIEMDNGLECEIAGEIHKLLADKNDEIAEIYLLGSYVLRRDTNNIEKRKQMQRLACEFYQKAIDENEYKPDEVATINYLIGELYRRVGEFEKADLYYEKALHDKNKKDWIEKVVTEQKQLVAKKDDNNNI
jgi:tetratricopeptide (TPR) repeat protein